MNVAILVVTMSPHSDMVQLKISTDTDTGHTPLRLQLSSKVDGLLVCFATCMSI